MRDQGQITVFAIDCGATNWRLFRGEYQITDASIQMIGGPQPAPLTSFIDRRLPAVLCLNPAGNTLESFGEVAQQQLDDELQRERVREHFKPCIGSHLEQNPLPHQKRYTHVQALEYTRLLLQSTLEQVRQEKLRSSAFDDRIVFTFAYPVHWRSDHNSVVFEDFAQTVRGCFPEDFDGLRFVAEPEGAILCLNARGLLGQPQSSNPTLIIDVGGSTTDVVAGQVDDNGRLMFLGRHGESFGGDLYDAEIAKFIADELKVPASALADDPSALISLRLSAQRLKESLSRQLLHGGQINHVPQRTVTLVMQDGSIYRRVIALDEDRFRNITAGLEASFTKLVDNALRATTVQEGKIGQVILVGGGAQLFTILGYLRQRFGENKVLLADNPEEIVVQGLCLEYGASFEKIEPEIQILTGLKNNEVPLEPAPVEKYWKLITEDDTLFLLPIGLTTIGRGEENDMRINDPKASRLHAKLQAEKDMLEVVDLGSTNGTYINHERLVPNQPRSLKPGDEVIFGKTRYVIKRN